MPLDELNWASASVDDLLTESRQLAEQINREAQIALLVAMQVRGRELPPESRRLQEILETGPATTRLAESNVLLVAVASLLARHRELGVQAASTTGDATDPSRRWFRLQFKGRRGRDTLLYVTRDLALKDAQQFKDTAAPAAITLACVNYHTDATAAVRSGRKPGARLFTVKRESWDKDAARLKVTLEQALVNLGASITAQPDAALPREAVVEEESVPARPSIRVEPSVSPAVAPSATRQVYGTPISEWDGFALPVPLKVDELEYELEAAFLATRADSSSMGQFLLELWRQGDVERAVSQLPRALDSLFDPDLLVDIARLAYHLLNRPGEAATLYRNAVDDAARDSNHRAHWYWMRFMLEQPDTPSPPEPDSPAARLRDMITHRQVDPRWAPEASSFEALAQTSEYDPPFWPDFVSLWWVTQQHELSDELLSKASQHLTLIGEARYRASEAQATTDSVLTMYSRAAELALRPDVNPESRVVAPIAYLRAVCRVNPADARGLLRRYLPRLNNEEAMRKQAYVIYKLAGDDESAGRLSSEFHAFTATA